MYGESRTTARPSSGGRSTESAATSGFAAPSRPRRPCPRRRRPCRSSPARPPRSAPPLERETSIRSSASECTSRSAPGGSRPSEWRTSSVERCSSQISRAEDGEERAHGPRDPERRALGVAERGPLRHELAEHDVEEAEDAKARMMASRRHALVELARQRRLAQGADGQRGERDAELHRRDEAGGSPVICRTSRARRLPWCCSSMIRVRRAVTRPYSAATKNALSRIRIATPISSKRSVTPSPPRGRRY